MLRGLAIVVLVAASAGSLVPQNAAQPADLVVLNAKILTVDGRFREAQALAVRDGRFVAVGSTAEVRARIGGATRVIDGGGRTVIPGLIDSHVHALGVAAAEAVAAVSEPAIDWRAAGLDSSQGRAGTAGHLDMDAACLSAAPARAPLSHPSGAGRGGAATSGRGRWRLRVLAQHHCAAGCRRDPRVSGSTRRRDRQGCPRRADGSPTKRRVDARSLPAQRIGGSAAGHARASAPAVRRDRNHERDRTERHGRGISGVRGPAARRPVERARDRDVSHPASRRRGPGRAVHHRPAVPVRQRR